jgi:hypothetical protein
MSISFSRQELLQEATLLQIYFFDPSMSCDDVKSMSMHPPSLAGPYQELLDVAGRERGVTFNILNIPAGTYLVFVDAVDALNQSVGSGCAPMQRVSSRQVSSIKITIS